VTLQEFPGEKFAGMVARTAAAIDPATRTLLTEVDVPNKSAQLLPGGYAQVHLLVKVKAQRLQVPGQRVEFCQAMQIVLEAVEKSARTRRWVTLGK